jgi:cellulose synthase/poly-beta-1,6-N-acetylglucosamine synthase-like glycosyltransferase
MTTPGDALNIAWILVRVLVGYNLVFPLFLYCIYALKGKKKLPPPSVSEHDYAIIVTAYEQTDHLQAVVASILQLQYSNYLVYIVADKCDVSGLSFNDERVIVLRPPQTLASNTRSHFYAIGHFARAHELLIIIDSDNLVHADCLRELDRYFDQGFQAVQGLRAAKNLDTTYACLDAARDMYYHFYDGELLFGLGSSATLAGSGMAFKVALYKDCLEKLDVTGAGFDKVLQKEIVSRGNRIAFSEHAIVYDEKTAHSSQLVKQRARWINTWFRYFRFGFSLVGQGLVRFDRNRLIFGVVLLRPPLFIFILLSAMFMLVDVWVCPAAVAVWLAAFGCFMLGFILAVRHARPDPRIYRSLWSIPKFVFYQVLSLLKARRANKISVATKHTYMNSKADSQ